MDFEAEEDEDQDQDGEIAQEVRSDSEKLGKQKTGKLEIRNSSKFDFSGDLEPEEREVLRQLEYFESVVARATDNFQPNELVKYLLALTKSFNAFYEKHHVVGSKNEEFRLILSRRVAETIKLGMYLLGIETVDKM